MSKRRAKNDLEAISDELLGELDPMDRLQFISWANWSGKSRSMKRLAETCPQHEYRQTDQAFTTRLRLSKVLANQSVYYLRTTLLQYERQLADRRYEQLRQQRARPEGDGDTHPDEQPEKADLDQTTKYDQEIQRSLVRLYQDYHACCRFATEVLDIDPKIWLSWHPDGVSVFEDATKVVTDQQNIEQATQRFDEAQPFASMILDALANQHYTALTTVWEETIETAS